MTVAFRCCDCFVLVKAFQYLQRACFLSTGPVHILDAIAALAPTLVSLYFHPVGKGKKTPIARCQMHSTSSEDRSLDSNHCELD